MGKGSFHPFYGWWIVAASFIVQLVVVGIGLYAPPVFLLPLEQHFGWSRTTITAGPGLAAVVCGLVSPLVGALTDRYGPRRVMLWGSLILGVSEVMLSRITSIGQYYTICALLPVGLAGAAWIPNQTLISNWFVRRRGAAMGLALTGIGFGGLAMASLAGLLIREVGWRATYGALGSLVLLVVLPVAWVMVRDRPADLGLRPDGNCHRDSQEPTGSNEQTRGEMPFREVLRSQAFWQLALADFLAVLGSLAIIGHLPAFLADHGNSQTIAANILGITVGLSVIGRLFYGYLADRASKKLAMVSAFGLFAAADLFLLAVDNLAALVAFVMLFGFALGGSAVLIPLMVADFFGLGSFAKTLGTIMVSATAAAAIGPVALGSLYDRVGTYDPGFAAIALVFVSGALLMIFTKPPRAARLLEPL